MLPNTAVLPSKEPAAAGEFEFDGAAMQPRSMFTVPLVQPVQKLQGLLLLSFA
jgi:hypothetical protein